MSYVYNPSKKVTELLSQYLEFDEEQLQLGIWSGNLALQNVNLKPESMPQMPLKLLSGKIGDLQLTIPWKRLVWGQGDVKVEIKDVVIVVSLDAQETQEDASSSMDEHTKDEIPHEQIQLDPERKQKRLREAEERHLQGKPLASWLNSLRKKDEEEQAKKKVVEDINPLRSRGRFETWLKSASSDFFWRFYAGLEMKVSNLKIIFVQDGMEVGLVVPLAEMTARDGTKQPDTDTVPSAEASVQEGAPQEFVYEGAYDDGEHVDKNTTFKGVGIYVRKSPRRVFDPKKIPDISTKDYLLRPVDITYSFSLFFPYPPEKRKRRLESRNTATSVDGSETSSKRRRGKRQKDAVVPAETTTIVTDPTSAPTETTPPPMPDTAKRALSSGARQSSGARLPAGPSGGGHRRRLSMIAPLPSANTSRRQSSAPVVSSVSKEPPVILPLVVPEYYTRTPSFGPAGQSTPASKDKASFDASFRMTPLQLIVSKRQFMTIQNIISSCTRVRNGRPLVTISSVLNEGQTLRRSLTIEAEGRKRRSVRLELHSAHTERSQIIQKWWQYAFNAVKAEIAERRTQRMRFRQRYLSFDWNKQRYKRSEYVDLYIEIVLEAGPYASLNGPTRGAQDLIELETILPIEQILLYRSIARALHVRGMHRMPSNLLVLSGSDMKSSKKAPRRTRATGMGDSTHSGIAHDDLRFSLADVMEEQCEMAKRRVRSKEHRELEQVTPLDSLSGMGSGLAFGIDADAMTSDNKTVQTFRTAKTRAPVKEVSKESSMTFSFQAVVEEVEVLFVKDDEGDILGKLDSSHRSLMTHEKDEDSEVSGLTEDNRFWPDEDRSSTLEEESIGDPIISSTDYLLFRPPEDVLLRFTIFPLNIAIYDHDGGKVVKFGIQEIAMKSGDEKTLFRMGARRGADFQHTSESQKDALTLTLAANDLKNTIQCDAALVTVVFHSQATEEIWNFFNCDYLRLPSGLVAASRRDEIRRFVLDQGLTSSHRSVDTSIRLHGLNVFISSQSSNNTKDESLSQEASFSNEDGFDDDENRGFVLRVAIFELYSGSLLDDLKNRNKEVHSPTPLVRSRRASVPRMSSVRRLKLIEVDSLDADDYDGRHWVFAISGVDFRLNSLLGVTDISDVSLLEAPVDFEAILHECYNPLGSVRAKEKVIARLSPLDLLVSEGRVRLFTSHIEPLRNFWGKVKPSPKLGVIEPLRIEVLSQYIKRIVDFSVSRVRIALVGEHYGRLASQSMISPDIQKDSFLHEFMKNVVRFDLSFPHEEALSSAMQICIDRLSGIGFTAEDSWEITNTCLLNFLEEMALTRKTYGVGTVDEEDIFSYVIGRCLRKTSNELLHLRPQSSSPTGEHFLALDLPSGIQVAQIDFFYDRHISAKINDLFVTNCDGIHLLRVTKPMVFSENDASFNEEAGESEGSARIESSEEALNFRLFQFDSTFPFAKGGDPLKVLGNDVSGNDKDSSREQIIDLDIGDVECVFTAELTLDFIEPLLQCCEIWRSSGSLTAGGAEEPTLQQQQVGKTEASMHLLAHAKSISILFASDELVPFLRLSILDSIFRSSKGNSDLSERSSATQITTSDVSAVDLTPGSEFHQDFIRNIGPVEQIPMKIVFDSHGGDTSIIFHNMRLVVVKRLINELMQYFSSGLYGLSHLLASVKRKSPSDTTGVRRAPRLRFSFHQTSILLPRSFAKCDMIAAEVERASLGFALEARSFAMPSIDEDLEIGGQYNTFDVNETSELSEFHDCMDCGSEVSRNEQPFSETDTTDLVSRKIIRLDGVRLYSSLLPASEDKEHQEDRVSFRYFFDIDGRAEPGKLVYRRLAGAEDELLDEKAAGTTPFRSVLRWQPLSETSTAFDIIVDHCPYMRVLLADDTLANATGLRISASLMQFGLLLSIWYENMQELPQLFPYSDDQMELDQKLMPKVDPPELGQKESKTFLAESREVTSEICLALQALSLELYEREPLDGVSLGFEKPALHIMNDVWPCTKIAAGAQSALLVDKTCVFDKVISCGDGSARTWADFSFGVFENVGNVEKAMNQPFKITIFMTPLWSLYNLGLEASSVVLSDMAPILRLLRYFTSYFGDPSYGNPAFNLREKSDELKESFRSESEPDVYHSLVPRCLDFRLWLTKPVLAIPLDPDSPVSESVNVSSDRVMWYRYLGLENYSSHEFISQHGSISLNSTVLGAKNKRQSIIEGLCLGLRYDSNYETGHTDVSVAVPFSDSQGGDLCHYRLCLRPTLLAIPKICVPYEEPNRLLGSNITEMTLLFDILPRAYGAFLNLFSSGEVESPEVIEDGEGTADLGNDEVKTTMSFVGSIGDMRLFVLDPTLGAHLPVAVLSVSSLSLTTSSFCTLKDDFQASISSHFWADYFKLGLTRSWEPLIESFCFQLLNERSPSRGTGFNLISETPFHCNISGAMLLVVDEVVGSFLEMFTSSAEEKKHATKLVDVSRKSKSPRSLGSSFGEKFVAHELPEILDEEDRVAFSIRNLSGEQLRTYRQNDGYESSSGVIAYLDHLQSCKLQFQPSISVIKNLSVVEVGFPGLANSPQALNTKDGSGNMNHTVDIQTPGFEWVPRIEVDTFGRSFRNIRPLSTLVREKTEKDWRLNNLMKLLIEVGLDNGGRQVSIRSLFSVVNKTQYDLSLSLNPRPDYSPGQDPNFNEDSTISSGESFQIPVLLIENALRQPGSHLGSLWLRPNIESAGQFERATETLINEPYHDSKLEIAYSSRPIQLATLVNESSKIFESNQGRDVSTSDGRSGAQISCPVSSSNGRQVAPFCFAVEIGRSPLVRSSGEYKKGRAGRGREKTYVHGPVAYTISIHPPLVITNLLPEPGRFELMHAIRKTVVWYGDLLPGEQVPVHSVGLDAPLLLLLNLGFCRTPVGEGALVHHGSDQQSIRENVGGLKLMSKVGVAATKKAGAAVTKKLGKTLTALGESPDKRGESKFNKAQNPKHKNADTVRKKVKFDSETDLGIDGEADEAKHDSNQYRVDSNTFYPQDIDHETSVVDSIGQRLTLGIDNARGGGGQRRISVFCPFWVVNTTEHAFRYRQENSKSFVSGTVHSSERDGSTALSGGRSKAMYGANTLSDDESDGSSYAPFSKTVFSGTPGVLAESSGVCSLGAEDVCRWIDGNLELNRQAEIAFMFNFHDSGLSIGQERFCMQLYDGRSSGRYRSDWSRGFSLDSVGYSQVVGMQCKDGRLLEVTAVVSVAPGPLAQFTKIIRILPRYVLANTLSYPIRLWQDNSIFRPQSSDIAVTGPEDDRDFDRKWRVLHEKEKVWSGESRINQYEALWGRETVLDAGRIRVSTSTTAHRTALYVTTIGPSEVLPFVLPDSRVDRLLRLGVGERYNLTSSFAADMTGETSLRISPATDLRLLKHVSTRSAPQYEVVIPQPGQSGFGAELGIWFETEWGTDKSVIVKTVKKDSYAFNQTDVRPGDELLFIDDKDVRQMTFAESTKILKDRLEEIRSKKAGNSRQDGSRAGAVKRLRRASIQFLARQRSSGDSELPQGADATAPLRLVFRTVEEKLRRVRSRAARKSRGSYTGDESSMAESRAEIEFHRGDFSPYLKVDVKTIHHNKVIILKENEQIPYQIQNQSLTCTLYFRQRGCSGHPWIVLRPGSSIEYTWEEPMKPKKLTVRVSVEATFAEVDELDEESSDEEESQEAATNRQRDELPSNSDHKKRSRKVKDEESAVFSQSVSVRLEEIGFRDFLPVRVPCGSTYKVRNLEFEVDVFKGTRVLVVQDTSSEDNEGKLEWQLSSLTRKFEEEVQRYEALVDHQNRLIHRYGGRGGDMGVSSDSICVSANKLMEDFPEESRITAKHQLVVEVIEAIGLNPGSFVGNCNPYAEVSLKHGGTRRNVLFRRQVTHRTYYVKQSVSPKWQSQSFRFDVSQDAVTVSRGYAIVVKLKNYRYLGADMDLGRASVDLHSLRDQKSLTGWFPLSSKTGQQDLEMNSYFGRGSVKLKLHWVYTVPALLQYYTLLSEQRMNELKASVEGMTGQLESKREAEELRREGEDGFKAVRVRDIVKATKKNQRRSTVGKQVDGSQNTISQQSNSIEPRMVRKLLNTAVNTAVSGAERAIRLAKIGNKAATPSKAPERKKMPSVTFEEISEEITSGTPPDSTALPRKGVSQRLQVNASGQQLEDRIAQQRKVYQKDLTASISPRSNLLEGSLSDVLPISSLKSWTTLQVLVSDPELVVKKDGNEMSISLRREALYPQISQEHSFFKGESNVLAKLRPPLSTPLSMVPHFAEYAHEFEQSRTSFEDFARCSLQSALNPGGWFTIRPITALNLPENHHTMFVRARYGSESLTSERVDARVSPKWSSDESLESSNLSTETPATTENDLNFYIAPQVSSGHINLSVFGERKQQKLKTKTEIGVLRIPLGTAIASCLHSRMTNSKQKKSSYARWFPLKDPRKMRANEGNRGLQSRPDDSEQIGDHLFKEYFAPCIQLELTWSPDEEEEGASDANVDVNGHSLIPQASIDGLGKVNNYFTGNIASISVAMIDSQRAKELLSVTALELNARYWVTNAKSRFGLAIGWLQVDQQDPSARDPVMLAATPRENMGSVLQVLAVKDNIRSKANVLSFEFIDLQMAELDLTVEEKFLFDLFEFIADIRLRRELREKASSSLRKVSSQFFSNESLFLNVKHESDEAGLLDLLFDEDHQEDLNSTKLYVEQLFLGMVRVNLSYLKGRNQSTLLERLTDDVAQFRFHDLSSDIFFQWTQHTFDEDRLAEVNGKSNQNLASFIASLFPNVSDAPIRLQGKALNHVFESPGEIFQSIQKFYVNETLRQIYKIIGSLDFVGNPTMLLSSFFSGVRDLVVAPSVALIKSPTDPSRVGIGVAQGTLSLVSHSTSGFFAFMSKVSAAAGQSVAALSLDSDFRTWHRDKIVTEATNLNREYKKRGVKSVRAMVVRPFVDVAAGVGSGVAGLILTPAKGLKREGAIGLVKGVGIAGIGLVARPTVGVLDAMAHFAGSVHDVAKMVNLLEKRYQAAVRLRLPYLFTVMNVLTPYNSTYVLAERQLKHFSHRGKKSEVREDLVHVEVLPNIGSDTYCIVTSLRCLLTRVQNSQSGPRPPVLCWEVYLDNETVKSKIVDHGHNGVALNVMVSAKSPEETVKMETEEGPTEPDSVPNVSEVQLDTGVDQDFDYGTVQHAGGRVIDYYSVVAEYQYRSCLGRLHNAICCLVSDFKNIIKDPSFGHIGNSEGFTSFGVLLFEASDEDDSERTNVDESFEDGRSGNWNSLPWISKSAILSNKEVKNDDLVNLPSYNEALNASQVLGGPRWLVEARARVLCKSVESGKETSNRQVHFPADPLSPLPQESKSESTSLVESHGSLDTESSLDIVTEDLGHESDSDNEALFVSTRQLAQDSGLSLGSYDLETEDSVAAPITRMLSQETNQTYASAEETMDDDEKSGEKEVSALESGGTAEAYATHAQGPSTEQRIERMEALMERLLIFSSEQALSHAGLQRTPPREAQVVGIEDQESLRHEIAVLRAELNRQQNYRDEIQSLRREIASLREQVASASHGGSTAANSSEGADIGQFRSADSL